ncbi:MAG: methyl-accepting chemotaxis protein [Elusimicrobia bacterium]|nr:methyl-accepting chemotaxis protein [Elusimicrobiota bacterium]
MTETTRSQAQFCRQTIIIKKALQYKYMAIMAISVLVGFLIFAMEVGWSLASVYREHPALLDPLFTQLGLLLPAFLLKVVIYFVIVLLVAGVISHKMAGPIYKFEKSASTLCTGDLTHRIFLRKGDQLTELQGAINGMASSLQELVKTDRAAAQKIAAELENLAASVQEPPVREKLLALAETAKTITMGFKI